MFKIKKNYLDNILYLSILYKTKVYKQISTIFIDRLIIYDIYLLFNI